MNYLKYIIQLNIWFILISKEGTRVNNQSVKKQRKFHNEADYDDDDETDETDIAEKKLDDELTKCEDRCISLWKDIRKTCKRKMVNGKEKCKKVVKCHMKCVQDWTVSMVPLTLKKKPGPVELEKPGPGDVEALKNPIYAGCSPDPGYEAKLSNTIIGKIISTPRYRKNKKYPSELKCDWTFRTDPGNKLVFTFDSVNTEKGYDEIIIFDGDADHARILLRYSGNFLLKRPINSSSNYMHVFFKSDKVSNAKGFQAKIMVIPAPRGSPLPPQPQSSPGYLQQPRQIPQAPLGSPLSGQPQSPPGQLQQPGQLPPAPRGYGGSPLPPQQQPPPGYLPQPGQLPPGFGNESDDEKQKTKNKSQKETKSKKGTKLKHKAGKKRKTKTVKKKGSDYEKEDIEYNYGKSKEAKKDSLRQKRNNLE